MLKTRTFFLSLLIALISCSGGGNKYLFTVTNPLPVKVSGSSIEIPRTEFNGIPLGEFERFAILDKKSGEFLLSQFIDSNADGRSDYLIFQPELGIEEIRQFEVVLQEEKVDYSGMESRTFSRFVPERTDDYAWENDRVAFRTYGPAAQQMVEEGTPGGTLSSGIDCWLKRVDYPIIDKWYREHLEEGKSYHEDRGEGLDNFHVGSSRGCGGMGIWNPEEERLYSSKNFSSWKTLSEGPLRTLFELAYEPWEGPLGNIHEKKIISLDLGNNLMKVELILDGEVETVSVGLTLHEKDGSIKTDEEAGWFSYWQPHADSELGMGIVVGSDYLEGFTEYYSNEPDQSHLLVHMKPVNGKVVYYAGFGWKNAGCFKSEDDWINYLKGFSSRVNAPLKLVFNN
jgi:hypothetical protein